MIPMFRVLASGYSRMTRPPLPGDPPCRSLVTCAASATSPSSFSAGTAIATVPSRDSPGSRGARPRSPRRSPSSPAVVRERLVRLGHLVHVLAPLHRRALAARGVHQLADQALGHGVLAARASVVHEPSKRERRAPGRAHLHWDLVGRAAHPAGLHLEHRARVLDGPLERDRRIVRRPLADHLERLVDRALGEALLAVQQHLVDQLRDERVLVDRVWLDLALGSGSLPRHRSAPYAFALAPYFDRAFFRSRTP